MILKEDYVLNVKVDSMKIIDNFNKEYLNDTINIY